MSLQRKAVPRTQHVVGNGVYSVAQFAASPVSGRSPAVFFPRPPVHWQLLHNRFFLGGGLGVAVAYAHNTATGAAIGAFPGSSEWQQVTGSVVLSRRATEMSVYVGYPTQNTRGWVDVTGYQIIRLGGLGSC